MKNLSLKAKMIIWYTLSFLFIIAAIFTAIHFVFKEVLISNAQNLIKAYCAQASSAIEAENGTIKFDESLSSIDPDIYFQILDENNQIVYSHGITEQISDVPPVYNLSRVNKDENLLIYDQQITEEGQPLGWIRSATSMQSINDALTSLLIIFSLSVPVCLIIAVLTASYLAKKFLRPIDKITVTAQSIGRGDLSKRLNMKDNGDEVGRLSSTFDEMIEKLEAAFKKEKQFTSDASHELRTPVSVISAYAEDALFSEYTNQQLRESFKVVLTESRKMNKMISHLLMITRGDDRKYSFSFESLLVSQILSDVTEEMKPAAQDKAIEISLDITNEMTIVADQLLVTRLFLNILENAVKYNVLGGSIKITADKKNDYVIVTVQDSGVGIPADNLSHVFDRFYRAAHTRDFDGSGLGLSIAKWIVDVHNGMITIDSILGSGTTVIVSLPINPAEAGRPVNR